MNDRNYGKDLGNVSINRDNERGDTFAEAMGNFTIDRVKDRIRHVRAIIERNDFQGCPTKGIREAWDALIEIQEIVAAGLCILVERRGRHPRTFQDFLWGLLDKSPISAALVFLGMVFLRINGFTLRDLIVSKGGP